MCNYSIVTTVDGGGTGEHRCSDFGFCLKERLLLHKPKELVKSMYYVPFEANVGNDVCNNEVQIAMSVEVKSEAS